MLAVQPQDEIILIADPRILAIPIKENHEPFVNLIEQKAIVYGPSPEIPNNTDYTNMRKSVYEKLLQAQALLPAGLSFCLYEGYRSLGLQKMLFENRYKMIQELYPAWDHDALFDENIKMVSPVVNKDGSLNTPPHSTGAAVDVYLLDQDGKAIDMGIHPEDWMKDQDGSVSMTNSPKISAEAQKNRDIMSHVLSQVGFINYPTEYWHWSYGDRYWAYFKNEPYAIYGTLAENH
jgi:D-alanyl-D-alanine dipeptidase